jgi:hypothetical protein
VQERFRQAKVELESAALLCPVDREAWGPLGQILDAGPDRPEIEAGLNAGVALSIISRDHIPASVGLYPRLILSVRRRRAARGGH